MIDESDATFDAFAAAVGAGYAGVSSKSCKGVYKSVVNAARCARGRAGRLFMSAEDLTAQAGLAVQQDLALAGLLGLAHVERNGHHYVDGFAGQGAPAAEQADFLRAYPELYEASAGGVRLAIRDGTLSFASVAHAHGAGDVLPRLETLTPLHRPVDAKAG
jgi:hypothetical protein